MNPGRGTTIGYGGIPQASAPEGTARHETTQSAAANQGVPRVWGRSGRPRKRAECAREGRNDAPKLVELVLEPTERIAPATTAMDKRGVAVSAVAFTPRLVTRQTPGQNLRARSAMLRAEIPGQSDALDRGGRPLSCVTRGSRLPDSTPAENGNRGFGRRHFGEYRPGSIFRLEVGTYQRGGLRERGILLRGEPPTTLSACRYQVASDDVRRQRSRQARAARTPRADLPISSDPITCPVRVFAPRSPEGSMPACG